MKRIKKCAFCGAEFVPNCGTQRYCSEGCAAKAKQQRKVRQRDFLKAATPLMDIRGAEYLSFSKAALLMGCSRQYVYKLVAAGKLAASRISSRMSFVRRVDIEAMLAANPYHRVLLGASEFGGENASSAAAKKEKSGVAKTMSERHKPESTARQNNPSIAASKQEMPEATTSAKSGHKAAAKSKRNHTKNPVPATNESPKPNAREEVPDYISGENVMSIYKVKRSWLYASAKRHQVPVCRIAGKNYFSRKHLDDIFGVSAEVASLTEWLTAKEAAAEYSTTESAIKTYAYRRHVPSKRDYGQTYYSKKHLDELFRPDLTGSNDYCTVDDVQRLYGLTKANICRIVKVNNITKVKVGVRNLLLKTDVERVMAARQTAQT